jgi:molybdopterin converting factor small subunit
MAPPYGDGRRTRSLRRVSAGEVEVHLFAAARAAVGASVVTMPAGSLDEILESLESAYPDFAAVRPRCSYLVDEVSARDLSAAVSPGSRIDVLPPFAGG